MTIKHFSHSHPLGLGENGHNKYYNCQGCGERILCRSFVYTCADLICRTFFLHKKCAHLPPSITTHHEYSNHQTHDLFLVSKQIQKKHSSINCKVCCIDIGYFYYYSPTINDFQVCLKCAIDLQDNSSSKGSLETIQHWSHQHTLLCVDRYATFHCDGCNKVSTDHCSYRCDKCSFWIHQRCADLPELYTCDHHKHPLTIASSIPEAYRHFLQRCKICEIILNERQWVYYCADCRYFAHILCVVYKSPKSGGLDDPKLVHLPAADEASMNFMMQKRIKDIISESVDTAMAPPDHINDHWAHPDHQLERKNKSDVLAPTCDHHHGKYSSSQVSSSSSSAESLMICDGCTKPISFSSDDADVFYECNQCKYILHRYCAQFPIEIETSYGKFVGRYERGEFGIDMFQCVSCFTSSNGFSFDMPQMYLNPLDIWCACLPEAIKHRAHRHPLTQNFTSCIEEYPRTCAACCLPLLDPVNNTPAGGEVVYGCAICDFYFLHVKCAVKPGTVLHRWDPHPLSLVLSLEDVENHPHGFECEFCSEEIDTNQWFYHCSVCDLSFHLHNCMDFSSHQYHYSNVKFGATNIRIEEAHQHNLTYVLNKNNNNAICGGCSQSTKDQPILLCKPCNFIRHPVDSCWKKSC